MQITQYSKRVTHDSTHHEGSCTFDRHLQTYDFVVNVKSNGIASARLYFTQNTPAYSIEDLLWFDNVSLRVISKNDIHHTVTTHHNATNDDEIMQPQPTQNDLNRMQEIYSTVISGEIIAHCVEQQ